MIGCMRRMRVSPFLRLSCDRRFRRSPPSCAKPMPATGLERHSISTLLLTLGGTALVLLVLADVFATVLFPASEHGPIRTPLSLGSWAVARVVASRLSGQRRRDVLSYFGPLLIGLTLVVWLVLLVVGWAMIYMPALGTQIVATSGAADTGWATALYFSGFNITTLGVGDLAATTAPYRLLSVLQAAVGFAFFSMAITYFLSVYSGLARRNAYAQGLHDLSGGTGDAAEILARLTGEGSQGALSDHLSGKAAVLREIHQSIRFYPVLRYFQYREAHYALPHILRVALDSVALLRTALDPGRYATHLRGAGIEELRRAATTLLRELAAAPEGAVGSPDPDASRRRYFEARERLAQAGAHVRADAEAGAGEYVALRSEWDGDLRALADSMLHEWDGPEQSARAEVRG